MQEPAVHMQPAGRAKVLQRVVRRLRWHDWVGLRLQSRRVSGQFL